MNEPYLIPGSGFTPHPTSRLRPRSGSKLLGVVIAIWLLGGVAVVIYHWLPSASSPTERTPGNAILPGDAADLFHHASAISENLTTATTKLRRGQNQIGQTIQALDREFLPAEKRRLDLALASLEAARRDVEQSRQDLELILTSLKEHQLQ